MHFAFKRVLIVALFALSFQVHSKPSSKVKTNKSPVVENVSLVQAAEKAIAVDPKNVQVYSSSPQNTGVLVVKGTELSPERNRTRFPIGVHMDRFSVRGRATAANKLNYDFSELGAPLVTSLRAGMMPSAPVLFDVYNLHFGVQEKNFANSASQSLRLTHYYTSLTGENVFYKRSRWDLRYLVSVGLLQSQVTSPENSLSNVTRRTNFLGLGLQSQYLIFDSLRADAGLTYNSAFASSEDYTIEPLGIGAGITFVW